MVFGRGILHLSVLIETMRREGYELQVGQPQVIIKEIDGAKCEPFEYLTVHVPEEFSGKVIEAVTQRKGDIVNIINKDERVHLEFEIPSRGLIGLRNILLTSTEGEAVCNTDLKALSLERRYWRKHLGSLIALKQALLQHILLIHCKIE